MVYKIKSAEELTTKAVEWVRGQTSKLTDFSVGSKARTLLEACAVIVEELYYSAWNMVKTFIEENIYSAFEFPLLPAEQATGTVLVGRDTPAPQDYLIPIGTLLTTQATAISEPIRFETTEVATLLAGTTEISIAVRAENAGSSGNVIEDTIVEFLTKPVGIEWVTNPSRLIGGRDLETKDERKKRFREYSASRSRGTLQALEYCAKYEAVGVADAKAVENPKLYAQIFDGTAYTDVTEAANDPFEVPVNLLPATENVDNAIYLGALGKFNFLYINFVQVGVGSGGVWEYWNGSSWVEIADITDSTTGLTQSGVVKFPKPADWRDSKINDTWAFWVRFRITSASYSVTPQIGHIFVSPPPGFVELYVQDGSAEASTELLDGVAASVLNYRGGGVTVNVLGPTKILVDVNCEIKVNSRYDKGEIKTKVEQIILDYMNAFLLGQNFVTSTLSYQVKSLEGGEAVDSVTIASPEQDILASAGEIIRPGTITVTVVN